MGDTDLKAALKAQADGLADTQAAEFAAKYSVVLQYDDTAPQGNGTGLSLTVFNNILQHQKR
jgi:hypothetical protein